MQSVAAQIASQLRASDVVTLRGEVGAGKTAFARALIGGIAVGQPDVTSPTFNLMQSYDVAGGVTLWHLDLYRLKQAEEAEALGLRELWEQIVVIEWPEVIEHLLPEGRLDVYFDFTASEDARSLRLCGNAAWRGRLETLKSAHD